MGNKMTKSSIISSLFWKLLEMSGVQGIQFVMMIILSRLLFPEDFGLILLVGIFIAIAGVIAQSGFNTALIQKKYIDQIDLCSVFYINLVISTLLYILLFILAPFIASFFAQPLLISVIRVLSLTLFLNSFISIQNVIIARNMEFKKLFISSLGGIILSGIVGIVMAYSGFGVWALVVQQLVNQLSITVALFLIIKWSPQLVFSMERIKNLFSYGWKLMVSSLLESTYSNINSLVIGKMFSPATLGYYSRGEQFPNLLLNNINGSIQAVLFPALSSQQENKKRMKQMVRRAIMTSSFITFPIMIGLAVIAEPLINILLTEKWMPAVPFLQIFCAVYIFGPIHTANLQAINALGRSDIFLKLEILKKLLGIVILMISISYGVYAIAIGIFIGSLLSLFINAYPISKLLNYSLTEQFIDVIPSFSVALVMGGVVFCMNFLDFADTKTLIIQIIVGIIMYTGLAKILNLEPYTYLVKTIKQALKRNKEVPIQEIYE